MDWLTHFNNALDYLEGNLDGEISFERAARLACCSVYHYQRMFSYLAGVPLSEYLRRRRLTRAAADLQRGSKVLDVALRYGYESPTAFNRAFQAIHGVAPSQASKPGVVLKAFSRISFQITIKGVAEMEYRIAAKEAFRIVGVRDKIPADLEEAFARVPAFWAEIGQAGVIHQIAALNDGEPHGILGLSTCNNVENEDAENFYYIATASKKPAPEGLSEFAVPACTWAIFAGHGLSSDLQELQRRIVAEWLPSSGYEWGNAPDIEVYLDNNPTNMQFEVWLPVVKAG